MVKKKLSRTATLLALAGLMTIWLSP